MKTKPKKRTRSQIVSDFKHRLSMENPKRTIKQWAESEGHSVTQVYSVTRGINKGLYGEGREIAEKIGLTELIGEQA